MQPHKLVIVTGQEGAGKSTMVRALLPHTPWGARIDAEDVGQVNPWVFDEAFRDLHRRNVAALVHNFWQAGYVNVIAGSFLSTYQDYQAFRPLLPPEPAVYIVQLCASKTVRDQRRIARVKPTSKQLRDQIDLADPEDVTLSQVHADFTYVGIDNSHLSVAEAIAQIKRALPDIYG